jgi:hypothetical protein
MIRHLWLQRAGLLLAYFLIFFNHVEMCNATKDKDSIDHKVLGENVSKVCTYWERWKNAGELYPCEDCTEITRVSETHLPIVCSINQSNMCRLPQRANDLVAVQ